MRKTNGFRNKYNDYNGLASYTIISAFMDLNGIRLRRTKVHSRALGKKKKKEQEQKIEKRKNK